MAKRREARRALPFAAGLPRAVAHLRPDRGDRTLSRFFVGGPPPPSPSLSGPPPPRGGGGPAPLPPPAIAPMMAPVAAPPPMNTASRLRRLLPRTVPSLSSFTSSVSKLD